MTNFFHTINYMNIFLDNICQYVFNRRKNLEAQNNVKKARRLVLEALDHLREVNSDKDLGAGGELGEILLYLFS